MNHLAENMQALRKAKGLTQEQLAERLEISRQAVSKWESGMAVPEMDKLIQIAQIYGCTLDELVCGETTPQGRDEQAFQAYNESWNRLARFVAGGVTAILWGVALLLLSSHWWGEESLAGLMIFLIITFGAVFGFVYAGLLHGQMAQKHPQVPDLFTQESREAEGKAFIRGICLGLGLILVSVLAIIFLSQMIPEAIAAAVMLALCGLGAGCLVYTGIIHGKMDVAAYQREQAGQESWSERASGVIMLLATAVFIILGFVWKLWHPGWVVFPIGGILCGVLGVLDKKQ